MPKGKKGVAMNSANAISEGIDTFENEMENKEVGDISSEKPLKKARGRPKKGAKAEEHSNGETIQNGAEEFKDNLSDQNSSKPSEDDKNSNQGSENEVVSNDLSVENPQKKKRGRAKKERKGSKEADEAKESNDENNSRETEKNESEVNGDFKEEVEEVAAESEVLPKKRGGRKAGRGRKPAASKEEESETQAERHEEEAADTEVVPKTKGGKNAKKAGRGRKAAVKDDDEDEEQSATGEKDDEEYSTETQKAAPSRGRGRKAAVKEDEEDEEESAAAPGEKDDEDYSTKTRKAAPSRGRGRRPAAPVVEVKPRAQRARRNAAQEPEVEKPKETRGRKRKNAPSDTVEEAILNAQDLEEAKNVKVSLTRQQDIDNMALKLVESEGVKAAAGTSGKGRGRKRAAAEDEGSDAGAPKRGRAAAASKAAPKKEKIPDVSALDFDNSSANAKGKSWNLKIATWNVNGLRAWVEKDGLSYLTHEDPDILCIQETKCSEDKIPPESNPVGYHCYWLAGDKDGYSGVGLMSKKKPLSVEYGIRKKVHDGEGRVITAEYDDYYLVATYVPNAGRKLVRLDYRKQWDIDFRAYLKKLDKTKPVILCGDLNVAHNEIDLANPKTNKKNAGFTQEERDGFSSLLSEGFVDAFRHLYPDTKDAYTFWTYLSNARAKNVGWRLDYFVLSERFTDNLCDCVIRKDVMGSDHCPLVLFLQI